MEWLPRKGGPYRCRVLKRIRHPSLVTTRRPPDSHLGVPAHLEAPDPRQPSLTATVTAGDPAGPRTQSEAPGGTGASPYAARAGAATAAVRRTQAGWLPPHLPITPRPCRAPAFSVRERGWSEGRKRAPTGEFTERNLGFMFRSAMAAPARLRLCSGIVARLARAPASGLPLPPSASICERRPDGHGHQADDEPTAVVAHGAPTEQAHALQ